MKRLVKILTVGALSLGILTGLGTTKSEASIVSQPAGSNFLKTALSTDYYMVQDSNGKTVKAKTTASTTVTAYNENYSTGSVTFVDYDKVTKTTYKTTVSTQVYTKASTSYKLTAKNYKGQTVNVKVHTGNVMTKVNASWYKDSFNYTTYAKVRGKWVKQSKTAIVYVPAKYVKGYVSSTWTKFTKKATGYFHTPPVPIRNDFVEYNRIHNLTDNLIAEAIEKGKQGETYVNSNRKTFEYGLPFIKDEGKLLGENNGGMSLVYPFMYTPYLSIMQESYIKAGRYENYSISDAKRILDTYKNNLYFNVDLFGSSITFHQNSVVVLRQNGKIIHPISTTGINEYAKGTGLSYPRYMKSLTVKFDNSEVDFSQKAELIVVYIPNSINEVTYEVDFNKYK